MSKTGLRFNRSQLDFLRKAEGKLSKASASAIKKTGIVMLASIQQFTKKPALSPSDLASLDHPYAKRHGKIQSVPNRKPFEVGKTSGKFSNSIYGVTTNQYEYAIRYKKNDETDRIVLGTKIMIGRDPINEGFKTKPIKNLFKKTIRSEFKKAMK